MKIDNQKEITARCTELFELLKDRKADPTRCHVLLLELRAFSDKSAKDGTEIPLDASITMGPELRMCCFDMFLGLLAASLNFVLPEKRS